jgi:hypothetical protein
MTPFASRDLLGGLAPGGFCLHLGSHDASAEDAVALTLDTALGTIFTLANGRKLTVQATAVDSGFNADQVMKFVNGQRRKSRACYAVKGRSGFDRLPLQWGGHLKGLMRLMLVGVDVVKHAVQKHLAMQTIEQGYIRLPDHLPQEYFDGLASEELRVRYVEGRTAPRIPSDVPTKRTARLPRVREGNRVYRPEGCGYACDTGAIYQRVSGEACCGSQHHREDFTL